MSWHFHFRLLAEIAAATRHVGKAPDRSRNQAIVATLKDTPGDE